MFIAVHYVRINGVMFTPNEIITESMSPEKVAWLLGKGAIRKAAEAPFSAAQTEGEESVDMEAGEATMADSSAEDANMTDTEDEDEAEDEFEDEAPMEIDAADSITPAEEPAPQAEEKPARKRRGRKE